jgi:hypothetical protein
VLTGAIDAALGGSGEAVLLTGEAGVAKTRCSPRRDTRGELRVPAQARVARA